MKIEYSFVIPHDVKTLIRLMGGVDTFERRLDLMVSGMVQCRVMGTDICVVQTECVCPKPWCKWCRYNHIDQHWVCIELDPDESTNTKQTQHRNEPDFATPYLYNYINKQFKSVHQSRSLATQ